MGAADDIELVRRGYEAFGRHDFDFIAEILHPDVRWHGSDEEDPHGGCRSRSEAISFMRQAAAQGITPDLIEVRGAGDRVLVVLQTDREDEDGLLVPHAELVSVADGKITAMIVYEEVDEAIRVAAGGAPNGS